VQLGLAVGCALTFASEAKFKKRGKKAKKAKKAKK
jgi:hypothetical protein